MRIGTDCVSIGISMKPNMITYKKRNVLLHDSQMLLSLSVSIEPISQLSILLFLKSPFQKVSIIIT